MGVGMGMGMGVGMGMEHGAALTLEDVTVSYPDGTAPVSGVDLTLAPGEIVALLGASGSGKSTLLRGIAGLERVSAGRILLDGQDVTGVPTHRRGVGMVFQDGQLFPHRSVARNVAYGLESAKVPRAARQDRVAQMLELVDLAAFGDRPVQNLSGGQAQRVALARSLAPSPRVLLLDEPLSALDRDLRERLAADIRQILKATGTTAVHVTHDGEEAAALADRVVRLHDDGSLTVV
ncbi:ABC transporter ATP-binding protein [Micrococcus lylae]|uniref:ABC transporter ATP-binding protein n=1 Tax=Micrococcus lylae TaxID=1273 RepID=UPI0021A5C395|nr:ABC transporter ATP-binding protein [Micrococcus lylae]MCT2008197.1 ABC transporter ATP-binding protein [Micrococcus lylae]MCT2072068.1 ABC transporter ATP-binding protein [Micrococcus lylae]